LYNFVLCNLAVYFILLLKKINLTWLDLTWQQSISYIAHHTLTVLLHLLNQNCQFCYFASAINPNAVISGHENKAVFIHLIFADPGMSRTCCWNMRCCPISVQFLATSFFSRTVHPPADRARETVPLLQRKVPSFIAANLWPPNSPDLNPVDYKVWGTMQDRVYWAKVWDVDDLKQRLMDVWDRTVWSKASSMTRSTSGVHDFVPNCPCPCKRGEFWIVFVTCIWTSS